MFNNNFAATLLVIGLIGSLKNISSAVEPPEKSRPSVVCIGTPPLDLTFSPSGCLAYGGRNGVVGVLDAHGRKLWTAPVGTYDEKKAPGTYGPDAHITGVGFVRGPKKEPGEVVVAASYDTSLRYFLASTGEFLFRPAELIPLTSEELYSNPGNHPSPVPALVRQRVADRRHPAIASLAVAPNGNWLAFMTPKNVLEEWSTIYRSHGEGSHIFGSRIQFSDGMQHGAYWGLGPIAISPDGEWLVSGGQFVMVLRARTLELVSRFKSPADARAVTAIACRPGVTGLEVAVGNYDGEVILWKVDVAQAPFDTFKDAKLFISSNKNTVSAAKTLDNPKLMEHAFERMEKAVEIRNGGVQQQYFKAEGEVKAHGNLVGRVVFSSDGKRLVTTGMSTVRSSVTHMGAKKDYFYNGPIELRTKNDVRVWDVETGRLIATFNNEVTDSSSPILQSGEDKGSSALAVALSRDDATIAAGFTDGTIRFWPLPK